MLKRGARSAAVERVVSIKLEQVEAAEARAEEALAARAKAQGALDASPYSELRALELGQASSAAAQLAASARELREAYERQVVAERAATDRKTLEKAAAAEIEAASADVEAARLEILAKAEAAQVAVYELLDVALAYNGRVRSHAATLAAAGLGFKGTRAETGGDETMQGALVRIKGRDYPETDVGSVAIWVTHRVGEARLPDILPIAGALKFFPGVYAVEEMARELLPELSAPKRVGWAPPPCARLADTSADMRGRS